MKKYQVLDEAYLVVADFAAGRQIWRGGVFDNEDEALSEFSEYIKLNFNPYGKKPKFVALMPVVLRK